MDEKLKVILDDIGELKDYTDKVTKVLYGVLFVQLMFNVILGAVYIL